MTNVTKLPTGSDTDAASPVLSVEEVRQSLIPVYEILQAIHRWGLIDSAHRGQIQLAQALPVTIEALTIRAVQLLNELLERTDEGGFYELKPYIRCSDSGDNRIIPSRD